MDRGSSFRRHPCPKQNAGFFSLLTFSYLLGFINRGRIREIEERDLYDVMDTFQSKKLGDELERHWYRNRVKRKNPSLIRSLVSCYGKVFLLLAVAQAISKVIYTYTMPWATSNFVSYFTPDQTETTRQMALYYALFMASITFLNGLWQQHFVLWKLELGIKMQAAISSLLYRKVLSLSQSKVSEISTGRIVTSMVKDVASLNQAILYGIDFVLESFQVLLVCYLLYTKMGVASIGSLGILCFSVTLQIAASFLTYVKRKGCNQKSDQRLQQTQEILSSIRLIKMYRWESFFKEKLLKLRKVELSNLHGVFVWKSISIIVGIVSGKLAQACLFVYYIHLGYSINAGIIYYVQDLFQKVGKAMIFIPLGIQAMAEFMVSLRRVDHILNSEENNVVYKSTIQMLKPEINLAGVEVEFGNKKILQNVNIKFSSGLHLLIGPSGCGKSTLLKALLEEFDISKGRLKVQGTISYANQNPWLFPSTLRQNILFGQKYEERKYNKVLEVCGLKYDFSRFANGDETILTDCGANLSRGQQCRINLARAIYKESDIYLLDDCLASLDVQIKSQVFNNAIKEYLRGKLCLLVTHSTHFVNQADTVTIMGDSTVKYSGHPSKIPAELFKEIEEEQNDDVDETTDIISPEEEVVDDRDEGSALLPQKKKDNIYEEKKKTGKVNMQSYKNYFKFGGGCTMFIALIGLHIICEVSSGAGDKFLSKWVNEQKVNVTNTTTVHNITLGTTTQSPEFVGYTTESLRIDTTTYFDTEISQNISFSTDSYLEQNISTVMPTSEDNSWLGGIEQFIIQIDMFTLYVAAIIFSTIFVVVRCFVTYYYTIKVSKNIHKSMATNILQGCMTFFDTNLIGNVLTRFSRDLYMMDELVPFIWLEGFRLFFLLPFAVLFIASVSFTLAVASAVLSIAFYFVCDYFLCTTRSTQRLSNSTLSPVIGHLNSTLEGLIIIRAYGTQHILKNEFDRHLDLNISANHLREMAARTLGFYSHTLATGFTVVIALALLFLDLGVLAGDVGLVLTQSNLLCLFLEFGIMMWMMMENNMTSVERVLEYTILPQENQGGRELQQWPYEGSVKFRNVSLTYRKNGETVLRNLNVDILPQEKIGIVGRTGAGKSSIIVTLFKMYDFSGDIMIDDVNIKTLSLECLRTHLSIIPQDPVIFKGTVRSNIDPKQTITDEQVWKTLEIVNLKTYFKSLDEDLAEKNLSIGQKQLICLARALTRRSKIVVLDEATANMDEKMDSFIQQKIRELFQFCTVITVAHRLHTVKNCDRIIVMDRGRIVEFDTPQNLLNNSNGLFYKMVHQKKEKVHESQSKKLT
ncbi:ATP-binding cassette sub-family C member 4-like [Coccinella septempunctata]|uniref:ATP-binding cassette sub-family C member 4-like n=1 Tax=Coccinella septempunctata TaxID=41139 RepID=UPI001D086F15|nr:ATP-binding cassette sub-family C member 4-like [Coccinella septempunctata]XP_044751515.1 ATP-binding cassette sub-family C member 4-like [Coccinella septempunctata]